jgi:glycosyltransferase involved in cell wall biosynthesis
MVSTAKPSPESAVTTPPTVSIGVPVYNGERYLRTALQSVLDSTFQDWEVIISDNASTDGTMAIIEEFMARDPRIRLNRNATNIGALPNFNLVADAARGTYFKWLAYDVVLDPDLLARCV